MKLARVVPGWLTPPAGVFGGAALLCLGVLTLVWYPLEQERARLERRVDQHREVLAAAQLDILRSPATGRVAAPRPRSARGEISLLALVERSARGAGIGITRMEPRGTQTVELRLDEVRFNDLVLWLARLSQRHAVRVAALHAERASTSGQVGARVILQVEDDSRSPAPER
jgi:type II secretory pathway component PulM